MVIKKYLKPLASILLLTALLTLPFFVFAQNPNPPAGGNPTLNKLTEVAKSGGYATSNPDALTIVALVIRAALSLLGIIFIIILIIAGFGWMTAGGNEEKVKKSSSSLKRAIIGLLISISAWAIWSFLLERLIIGH